MSSQLFYKFPSTPYLISSTDLPARQDRVLSESESQLFFENEVIVEEKIDGANLGISFTSGGIVQFQNRGHYLLPPYSGQWKPLEAWLDRRIDLLFDSLLDRYILFGEWCYATHSIFYNSLPDWFLAFDVFDKKSETFLSVVKRNRIAEQAEISVVPTIFSGKISSDCLDGLLCKSAYGEEKCEGLYLRIDTSDHLLYRAKYVRKDFLQVNNAHWSKQGFHKNCLRFFNH